MKVAKIHVSGFITVTQRNIHQSSRATALKLSLSNGIQMESFLRRVATSMIDKLLFGMSKEIFKWPHLD